MRPTWAEIDLGAIAHNTEVLRQAAGSAELCAVVKADGYSHGAVPVARTAIEAGASWLAIALVDEGVRLREAGITAPILLLSEPRPSEMVQLVEYDIQPAVYSGEGVAAAAAAAVAHGVVMPVHLKIDTGMGRVGASPAEAVAIAEAIAERADVSLESIWTHCAVADWPNDPRTGEQLARLDAVLAELADIGIEVPRVHTGNSAVALAHPAGHRDMVRCGISLYGVEPDEGLAGDLDLRPALRVLSEVSFVKKVTAGTAVSYGLEWTAPSDTVLATVPIGYADGVRRSSGRHGVEVLIGGRRVPIVGTVTMDQLLVDCGPASDVTAGAEVVVIGSQGEETITANEIAGRLDTIGYEVLCAVGPRVRRRYL